MLAEQCFSTHLFQHIHLKLRSTLLNNHFGRKILYPKDDVSWNTAECRLQGLSPSTYQENPPYPLCWARYQVTVPGISVAYTWNNSSGIVQIQLYSIHVRDHFKLQYLIWSLPSLWVHFCALSTHKAEHTQIAWIEQHGYNPITSCPSECFLGILGPKTTHNIKLRGMHPDSTLTWLGFNVTNNMSKCLPETRV